MQANNKCQCKLCATKIQNSEDLYDHYRFKNGWQPHIVYDTTRPADICDNSRKLLRAVDKGRYEIYLNKCPKSRDVLVEATGVNNNNDTVAFLAGAAVFGGC